MKTFSPQKYDHAPSKDNVLEGEAKTVTSPIYNKGVADKVELAEQVEFVIKQIEMKQIDIAPDYKDWVSVGFALCDAFGAGDLAKAKETIKAKDAEIDNLKKRCNAYARKYNTDKAEWDKAKGELEKELQEAKNSLQTYIGKNIDLVNDLRIATGRQSFIANQSVSLLNELTKLSADSITKVREVAFALILGNGPVYVPCSGGGSVSSNDDWDGRKKDEDDYLFRLRCWLHAGKVMKNACAPKKTYKIKG